MRPKQGINAPLHQPVPQARLCLQRLLTPGLLERDRKSLLRHSLFGALTLGISVIVLAAPARAQMGCSGGAELFFCVFSQGQTSVTVCHETDGTYSYAYGRTDQLPDLALRRQLADLRVVLWNGIGRTLWEELSFSNLGVDYVIGYSVDRLAEGDAQGALEGTLGVQQGEVKLASLACDPGSVRANFTPLATAVTLAAEN